MRNPRVPIAGSDTLPPTVSLMYVLYMSATRVSIAELRARLADVLRDVEQGSELVVMRRARPVARLIPVGNFDARLRAAGLEPPRREGPVPRVKPRRLGRGPSLTRTVLEDRE
jgi:prevent-host-death family protein